MPNYFKLSLIEPQYEGYLIDIDGNVYDRLQYKLIPTSSGKGDFYVTLAINDGRGLVKSFIVDNLHLFKRAKAHPDWKKVFPKQRTFTSDIEDSKIELKKETIMSFPNPPPDNLFPLRYLSGCFDDYFLDVDGNVYSNKIKSKGFVKLSCTNGGSYKLGTRIRTREFLLRTAKMNSNWNSIMPMPFTTKKNVTENSVIPTNGQFIIASVVDGKLVIGSNPKVHIESSSLTTEMERLAKACPGTQFIALMVTKTCVAGAVKWN
jgi:hypothetical protein